MNSFGLGIIAFRTLRKENETPTTVHLHERAVFLGETLVLIGIVATFLVALAHLRNLRRLRRGEVPSVARFPLSVGIALLLALIFLGALWYLPGTKCTCSNQ